MENKISFKIIENLESNNKTLKYTLNIKKNEISENNFWIKFIWNIAKNSLRDEFKEKILEKIEIENKYFDENVWFKFNDFIWIKKWKEFDILCDLVFQKNSLDWEYFLDKENICEFKNNNFVTFPNRLISVSPVFWIKNLNNVKKFFSELKKSFLKNLHNSEKFWEEIFYEKILEILERNISDFKDENLVEIKNLFWKIMVTQENIDKKLLEFYKEEIIDSIKPFSRNNWKNVFSQKIEIWYNFDRKSFHILDWTHRFKAFLDLLEIWKIWIKYLNRFEIKFSNSVISCDKNLYEIWDDWDFLDEILKDEKTPEDFKVVYLK